jgi:hypothetical protein
MNVFVAEHPIVSKQGRHYPRLKRWLLVCLSAYPAWVLLLGPLWALDGRGAFDSLPWSIRRIPYLPAVPLFYSQSFSPIYEGYMNWWYSDPDAVETTP